MSDQTPTLGDAIRELAEWDRNGDHVLDTDHVTTLADRADELEAAYRVADAEIARLSEFHDHYRGQVERVRALLTAEAPDISCAGHRISDDGCFVRTLGERITAALDGTQ